MHMRTYIRGGEGLIVGCLQHFLSNIKDRSLFMTGGAPSANGCMGIQNFR